jgi:uncharacterized membrane protein
MITSSRPIRNDERDQNESPATAPAPLRSWQSDTTNSADEIEITPQMTDGFSGVRYAYCRSTFCQKWEGHVCL